MSSLLAYRKNARIRLVPADTYARPTLTACAPAGGLSGTSVVLTGTVLTTAQTVYFGALAATSFTVDSATQITAVAPGGIVGIATIVVTTLGGQAQLANAFTTLPSAFTGQLGTALSMPGNIEPGAV